VALQLTGDNGMKGEREGDRGGIRAGSMVPVRRHQLRYLAERLSRARNIAHGDLYRLSPGADAAGKRPGTAGNVGQLKPLDAEVDIHRRLEPADLINAAYDRRPVS